MSPSLGVMSIPSLFFVCMSEFPSALMDLIMSEKPSLLAWEFFLFLGLLMRQMEGRSLLLSQPFAGSIPQHFQMFERFSSEQELLTRLVGWRLSQVLEHLHPREGLQEVHIIRGPPVL